MAERKLEQQFYFKGAEADSNVEFASFKKGKYYDAKNFRTTSIIGNSSSLEKIYGEDLTYDISTDPLVVDASKYVNIGAIICRGYYIAFWAATDTQDSLIQIDDTIVCMSADLPLTYDHPLQIVKNESCIGGEIYLTDENVPPMIFNVQDLVDSILTQKYFSEFNLAEYVVLLKRSMDVPVFDGYSGTGLKVGQYSYSYRYVSTAGDRTNFSASTPLIPVVAADSESSTIYPASMTYGAAPGTVSGHGIKLRLRINNQNNYSYIEIRRIYYNAGTPLGYVPTPELYKVPNLLADGQESILEFVDDSSTSSGWLTLTDEEDAAVMSAIDSAKAIRYSEKRIELGNINYASRDIEDDVVFLESTGGNKVYPFVHRMGTDTDADDSTIGHADPYNSTYYKSYQHGEKSGFGVQCSDGEGNWTFTVPITGFTSYQIPNRRDEMNSDSVALSVARWKGAVGAACSGYIDGVYDATKLNAAKLTHEVFDLGGLNTLGKRKTDFTSVVSITTNGGRTYNPLAPKVYSDTDVSGHRVRPNDYVWVDGGLCYYAPGGFAPRYFSQGIAIHGINTKDGLNNNGTTVLPEWVQSFRVVRTKPAGRVVASGLAMYSMNDTAGYARKDKDKIWFFSDDIDKGYSAIDDWTRYKIEVVSPLGFFSEMYACDFKGMSEDFSSDVIAYARLLYNDYNINPLMRDANGASMQNQYTKFGKWRNTSADIALFPTDKLFGITGGATTVFTPSAGAIGRSTYYELTLDDDIYQTVNSPVGGAGLVNNADMCNWHEPFYIVNIIDENAVVEDNNINNYIETGHHQKLESILGTIDQTHLSFDLVDERFEDCISNKYTYTHSGLSDNVFVYIRDGITERAWLDITYKTTVEIQALVTDIDTNGFALVNTGVVSVPTKRIYGLYYHTWGVNDRDFTVYFQDNSTLYTSGTKEMFIPSSDTSLIVKYDNRFPLKVFGGDVIIGESIFAPIDGQADPDDTNPFVKNHQFNLHNGFPYYEWYMNPGYCIIKNARALGGANVQLTQRLKIDYVRQLCVMFTSENRCNLPFSYNVASDSSACSIIQNFPRIHYVQRPQDWSTTEANNFGGNKIDSQYQTDFPREFDIWDRGGFKFMELANVDYSEWKTDKLQVSKPKVGYTEKTAFCSRIIWSLAREINVQDTANLKTFYASNYFDISDSQGGIKYLFDAESNKGTNLYAITNNGICLLLTNKNLLSDVAGNQLSVLPMGDALIQAEYWLQKDIGMDDEWWRSAAEEQKALFFTNSASSYYLFNNQIKDIGRLGYLNKLYNDGISKVGVGYSTPVTAGFDKMHEQYWVQITPSLLVASIPSWTYAVFVEHNTFAKPSFNAYPDCYYSVVRASVPPTPQYVVLPDTFTDGDKMYLTNNTKTTLEVRNTLGEVIGTLGVGLSSAYKKDSTQAYKWSVKDFYPPTQLFVFETGEQGGEEKGQWCGRYDYSFEKYISDDTAIYGIRDMQIFKLDEGYSINNDTINAWVVGALSPDHPFGKEFIEFRVNSSAKPTSVQFAGSVSLMPECELSYNSPTTANAYYVKDYNGWVNKIPRKFLTDDNRLQGRLMVYKIRHNTAVDCAIMDALFQYRLLRLQ